jgi:hypothetical protein
MPTNTILVIGSTGKTGQRVAGQLGALGTPVRHGSRSAEIPFDWESPQTWACGLDEDSRRQHFVADPRRAGAVRRRHRRRGGGRADCAGPSRRCRKTTQDGAMNLICHNCVYGQLT